MEKEFVPYEQALELKELGFDEPCFMFYSWIKPNNLCEFGKSIKINKRKNSILNNSGHISSPLWQQAFRWFWDTQGLYVEFFVDDDQTFGFLISRFVEEGRMDCPIKRGYSNPEIAEFNCLKELISIIK
jgi:hypothetical protein